MSDLSGKKIAFLANRGVEQPELTDPWKAIEEAGGEPVLVSAESGTITALKGDWDRGDTFDVDVALADAQAANYDALVLPGGTLNADSSASTRMRAPSCGASSTRASRWP